LEQLSRRLHVANALPNRFPTMTLDEFVVMPDHVHCLLWLAKDTPDAPTLGKVIGAYKSLTTVAWLRHIEVTNMNIPGRFWQRNYYERIIRDRVELEQTRTYIRNNPLRTRDARIE
jgi:putative transposase